MDVRVASEAAPQEHLPVVDRQERNEIATSDLNSLIRRRGGATGGGPADFRIEQVPPAITVGRRPDIIPLALMAKDTVGEGTHQPANGAISQATGADLGNGAAAAHAAKRRQLTLRLRPEEFDRLRTVAMIAHTSYQEILASAAATFLDHVLPRGDSPNEERIADGWHRLKSGKL